MAKSKRRAQEAAEKDIRKFDAYAARFRAAKAQVPEGQQPQFIRSLSKYAEKQAAKIQN